MSRRIQTIVLEGVLAVLVITTVFPFVWRLVAAFKPNREIVSLHQSLLPQEWTLENFTGLQDKFDFLRFFLNSLGVALVITAVTIYTSCLCGYVLAKYRFRGRNAVFGFILGTMMIPASVLVIPLYLMMAKMGLNNTFWGIVLPFVFASPYAVFLQGVPGYPSPRFGSFGGGWMNRLLQDYRVVLLDQRGTGQSTRMDAQALSHPT